MWPSHIRTSQPVVEGSREDAGKAAPRLCNMGGFETRLQDTKNGVVILSHLLCSQHVLHEVIVLVHSAELHVNN